MSGSLSHRVLLTLPASLRHLLIDGFAGYRQLCFHVLGTRGAVPTQFWGQARPRSNEPETYVESPVRYDIEFISGEIGRLGARSVLEFGCNAGRILRHLAARYRCVGIEINAYAVEIGKKAFPELNDVEFHLGDGASTLESLPDNYVDLSYTSHTLRHVGEGAIGSIARSLTRVTAKYLITSEDESSLHRLTFPRNYQTVFEPLGWRQIAQHYAIDLTPILTSSAASIIRVFERAHVGRVRAREG